MIDLFNGDAYAIIEGAFNIDLSQKNDVNGRRLSMDFDIHHTDDSSPSTGTVTIYNLKESTRKQMETKDLKISVFAGYKDFKMIGSGDIKDVVHTLRSATWETKITIGDGKKTHDKTVFNRSYKEGIDIKSIVDEVTKSFEIPVRDITSALGGATLGGLSLTGKSKDIMNDLSQANEFDWSIIDGELLITDQNKDDGQSAIVANVNTGLINTPQHTDKGVKFDMQLNPDVRPKRLVILETRSNSSSVLYRIGEAQFTGNNYGGRFDVRITAIKI